MIDCRSFQVSNIRPLAGEVLIEIVEPTASPGGIHFPQTYARFVEDMDRMQVPDPPKHIEAIVRKIGPENRVKAEFVLGDRVIVDRRTGRTINQPPRSLKLVAIGDVLAKFV